MQVIAHHWIDKAGSAGVNPGTGAIDDEVVQHTRRDPGGLAEARNRDTSQRRCGLNGNANPNQIRMDETGQRWRLLSFPTLFLITTD